MAGPSKAEIWQFDFTGSRGHEQKKERPAIIWRDLSHLNLMIVIPLTSKTEHDDTPHTYCIFPTPKNGLEKESLALIYQIATLDSGRKIKKLGTLEDEHIQAISVLLKDLLRL